MLTPHKDGAWPKIPHLPLTVDRTCHPQRHDRGPHGKRHGIPRCPTVAVLQQLLNALWQVRALAQSVLNQPPSLTKPTVRDSWH